MWIWTIIITILFVGTVFSVWAYNQKQKKKDNSSLYYSHIN